MLQREKKEGKKKVLVKEGIGGKSTAKPVFQIRTPERKKEKKISTQILEKRRWRCREKSMQWQ